MSACFLNMAFCSASAPEIRRCAAAECDRYLTDDSARKARDGGQIVAFINFHNLSEGRICHSFRPPKKRAASVKD